MNIQSLSNRKHMYGASAQEVVPVALPIAVRASALALALTSVKL